MSKPDERRALYTRQKKNRGGPLVFAKPNETVWSERWNTAVPAELAALPDEHYEPFRTPVWNGAAGRYEPSGAMAGWRLTRKGRAAMAAAV